MMASDTPELRVHQRLELRGDLGQRGQAAVVDHGAQQVGQLGVDSGVFDATPAIELEDLRGADLGVVGELAQLASAADGQRHQRGQLRRAGPLRSAPDRWP